MPAPEKTKTDLRAAKRRPKQDSDEYSEDQQVKKGKDGNVSLGEEEVPLNNGDAKGKAQDVSQKSPNARSQSLEVYRGV